MKLNNRWPLLPLVAAVMLTWTGPVAAQALAKDVPTIPHEPVEGFIKLPEGMYFGEALGVATNSQGHIFIYTRSGDTRLFEFDQNGNYVREIGVGLYGLEFAH